MASPTSAHHLKHRARLLSRKAMAPIHHAVDDVAATEDFNNRNQRISVPTQPLRSTRLLDQLDPGDLLLLGGRPGQGKTLIALELVIETIRRGHCGAFFSLECNHADVVSLVARNDVELVDMEGRFKIDLSDYIDAHYVIRQMATAPRHTIVVIDYLQLLDRSRQSPELSIQLRSLKTFARARGLIVVVLSQIDRSYERTARICPDLQDVRMHNPVNLMIFDKACFLNRGIMRMQYQ